MALVSLLLGQAQRGTRIARDLTGVGITSSIFLDATVSEAFSAPSEVSQHPIEAGGEIADHVILKSQKLTIEGVVSESPYSIGAQVAGIVSTAASRIGQSLGGNVGALLGTVGVSKAVTMAGILRPKSVAGGTLTNTDEDTFREKNNLPGENLRLRDAIEEFLNIRQSRRPVTIITGLKMYKNFIMVGCDISRDNSSGQSIRVSLEFIEIRVSVTETRQVIVPSTKSGYEKQKLGRKTTTPASNNQTILYGIVNGG